MAKLYVIREAGGITFPPTGKHYPEHAVADLLADGWAPGDVDRAMWSGMVAEAEDAPAPERETEEPAAAPAETKGKAAKADGESALKEEEDE